MPGFKGTMREFKARTLHSGSKTGPIVTNPKQALAIAYNTQAPADRRNYTEAARRKKRGKAR